MASSVSSIGVLLCAREYSNSRHSFNVLRTGVVFCALPLSEAKAIPSFDVIHFVSPDT
jgi:hypothetical protein